MYRHPITIRMHDTDAAGIIFFTSLLRLAHDAFEAFLDSEGLGLGVLLHQRDYRIPIVRAEADYLTPVRLGDRLTVEINLERLGTTSFALRYRLLDAEHRETGAARIVQVAVDARTWKKRPLPDELRDLLSRKLASA